MSQTQTDPTQTQTPSSSAQAATDDDPLAHLHKMSTTAGLGSGDYVAVNGAAVAALLLGLASGLTLIAEVLLILPVACIVVSVIAWRQIRQSNGTQTGRALIVVGLLCALLFGGFIVTRETTRGWRTRQDRAAIAKTINAFGEKLESGDVEGAHQMLSPRMQKGVPLERFKGTADFVRQSELYGKLNDTQYNGLVAFEFDDATGQRFASTRMKMTLEKGNIEQNVVLRQEGDQWLFEGMEAFFPPQNNPRQ